MIDRYGRTLNYLRVSVTDRCNLRCRYCVPARGQERLPRRKLLSFDEIVAVVRRAVEMGVTKVRLTGGEPLLRPGIARLMETLAGIEGICDLAMTTNGTLLAGLARTLAEAGLRRVNVSLGTMDADRFRYLTRGGDIRPVLAGLEAAQRAGLHPVKLNCVTGGVLGPDDAQAVQEFGRRRGLSVRLIQQMDFRAGRFQVVEGGSGGDCTRCTRLRLSSDGRIRPCLFSDLSFSVRQLGPDEALRRAVIAKPECGGPCTHNWMRGIGG